jgi:hypothetical protein
VTLFCARTLNLRMADKRLLPWIVTITLIIAQAAICLFYFPVKPIAFGLILLGTLYALTSLAANFEDGDIAVKLWVEPTLAFSVFFILSFLL